MGYQWNWVPAVLKDYQKNVKNVHKGMEDNSYCCGPNVQMIFIFTGCLNKILTILMHMF